MNTLTNLAISNNRENKTRSILIISSIFLTTLLLTVITAMGYGMIKSNHVNAGKLYGNYYGSYQKVTQKQIKEMKLRNEFAEIGRMAYAGQVESKASVSLYYADNMLLSLTNNLEQLQEGVYPKEANEITGQKSFFKELGDQNPRIGDTVTLKARVDKSNKYKSKTFVISGLLKDSNKESLNNSQSVFVSESYYNQETAASKREYNVYFRLNDSVPIQSENAKEVLTDLAGKCGIKEKLVSVNSAYIMWYKDPGIQTMLTCAVLAIMVILFSVVVIYNIFQVGLSRKIQEYGKLKALGATKRQLKKVVLQEGMLLAAPGIPLGVLSGYLVSAVSFQWLISQSDQIRGGISLDPVSLFSLPLLLLVVLLSAMTVYTALKKPMKIVASISAVEAMRYQESSQRKSGIRKGATAIGIRELSLANLSGNRKRTIATICTMGLSCVLFVALANFIGNIDENYEARRYVDYGQFYISLDYSLTDSAYPENNLDSILSNNPLSEELVETIRGLDKVTEVKTGKIFAVKAMKKNKAQQLEAVSVLSREDVKKHIDDGSTLGSLDYDKAAKENAIFYGWSHFLKESGYALNQSVTMELTDQKQSTFMLTGAFGALDTDWGVTEDTYQKLGLQGNHTGFLWVDCKKKDVETVREELRQVLSEINHVDITLLKDALRTTKSSTNLMKLGVYTFLAIIGLIGFMNMANTMITSMITRKQEFGILQAIGMTNRQLNHMLLLDGLIFTVGTVAVALAVGTPAGYGIFLYGRNNSYIGLHEYHFPVLETVSMLIIIAAMQIILSFVLSRNVKKATLVERIRYHE